MGNLALGLLLSLLCELGSMRVYSCACLCVSGNLYVSLWCDIDILFINEL